MRIIRNKEFVLLLIILLAVALSGTYAVYRISPLAAVPTGILSIILFAVFFTFTSIRYRHLTTLGEYLMRVNGGDYSLEPSDNEEGELSILKSEIYKVTVSLREQNERLSREKSQLADSLSDISHQFKTPLTSMSVMIDLLVDGRLDEGRRGEFTVLLQNQIERLKWLTEALLKLSKLDAHSVSFNRQDTDVSELIKKSCQPLLISMELKSIALSVAEARVNVYCDINWTAEALSNILKNCVEHTPQGGRITVKVFQNAFFTEIKVRDSGSGIDKSDLPHIFDRFYRGKNAGRDSVGIGLAMAKIILNAQDGVVGARNAQGGGAEFAVRFSR